MVADAFSISSWCLTLGLASSMKFQKSKKQKLNYSPVVEGRSAREGVPKRISNTPPLLKIKIMVSGPPKGIKESGSSPDPATGWVTCCWSVPRKSETVQTEVRTVPGHPGPTGRAKEHCRGSMRIQPDACWGFTMVSTSWFNMIQTMGCNLYDVEIGMFPIYVSSKSWVTCTEDRLQKQ